MSRFSFIILSFITMILFQNCGSGYSSVQSDSIGDGSSLSILTKVDSEKDNNLIISIEGTGSVVKTVNYFLDSSPQKFASSSTPPFKVNLDTSNLKRGNHIILVKIVVDILGEESTLTRHIEYVQPPGENDLTNFAKVENVIDYSKLHQISKIEMFFNDCFNTATGCSIGSTETDSIFVEFKFSEVKDLHLLKFYGDKTGTWVSENISFFTKLRKSDNYSQVVDRMPTLENKWFTKKMTDVSARYVKIVINGTPGSNRVQAMKVKILGEKSSTQVDDVIGKPPVVDGEGSSYLASVDIPSYDSKNPSHNLITTSNGNLSLLNSANKIHHYIKPGNYGDKVYTLTADGTSKERRTLSLENGDNRHPGKLVDSQHADINLKLSGANYWTIDRVSNINSKLYIALEVINSSTHNIFNRLFFKNVGIYGITIRHGSNNNTVQKSYFSGQSYYGRSNDGIAIELHGAKWNSPVVRVYNTKILDNDIKNFSDGFQSVRQYLDYSKNIPVDAAFDGTVLDGNNIWIEKSLYTNQNGSSNPNGEYAVAENGMDIKAGSNNPNNPMIISNNHMWGFRKSAKVGKISSWGGAIAGHYGSKNLVVEGNYIFNSARVFSWSDPKGFPFALGDSLVRRNVFIQKREGSLKTFNTVMWFCKNVEFKDNIYKGDGTWMSHSRSSNLSFDRNIFLGVTGPSVSHGYTLNNNYFYKSPSFGNSPHVYGSESAANMADYTFEYERYTGSPKVKTLEGVVTTAESPHK